MRTLFKNVYSTLKHLGNTLVDFIFPEPHTAKTVRELLHKDFALLPPSKKHLQENTYSLWDYQNPLVKEIVWQIKFYENEILIHKIAPFLRDTIRSVILDSHASEAKTYLIIPVPISKRRRKDRGYNQSEYIAKAIHDLLDTQNITYNPSILIKHRDTEQQTRRSRQHRLTSLKNSFAVTNNTLLEDKNVIIIDDVTTTGATLKEVSSVLKKSGAREIICFTIAH